MLNLAAAFGGGIFIRNQLENLPTPSLRRAEDLNRNFKLSLRVVAASAPALKEPGVWSRQRPKLQAVLGDITKETELADYSAEATDSGGARCSSAPFRSASVGACARECPWRFGDSLTFVATLQDIVGPGIRLRLRAHSDLTLGMMQLQWAGVADLGETAVDLRRRVLPACVGRNKRPNAPKAEGSASWWESPVLLIPLLHVRGGLVGEHYDLNEPTGHVAVVFSLNADPEALLAAAEVQERGVTEVLASRARGAGDRVMAWLDQPIELGYLEDELAGYVPGSDFSDAFTFDPAPAAPAAQAAAQAAQAQGRGGSAASDVSGGMDAGAGLARLAAQAADVFSGAGLSLAGGSASSRQGVAWDKTITPADVAEAQRRAAMRSGQSTLEHTLDAPDLSPEGWISRKGPGGRRYWHHRALGPAPWESVSEEEVSAVAVASTSAPPPAPVEASASGAAAEAPRPERPGPRIGGVPARCTSFGAPVSQELRRPS